MLDSANFNLEHPNEDFFTKHFPNTNIIADWEVEHGR